MGIAAKFYYAPPPPNLLPPSGAHWNCHEQHLFFTEILDEVSGKNIKKLDIFCSLTFDDGQISPKI